MEDNLKSHRFFARAVKGIVSTYLRLYDLGEEQAAAALNKAQEGGDPHDLKAAEKKAKREAAKAAKKKADAAAEVEKKKQEEAAKKPKEEASKKKGKEEDDDPDGEKLVAKNPLPEASTWIKELLLYSYDNTDVHVLAGEVFSRCKRYLLWLRSLKHAHSVSPQRPEVVDQRVRLLHALETTTTVPETVRKVVDLERSWLGTSAQAVLDAIEGKELGHVFVSAKGRNLVDNDAKTNVLKTLSSFDVNKDPTSTLDLCTRVLEYLEQEAPDHAGTFKASCAAKFNCSPRFMEPAAGVAFRTAYAFQDPLTAEHSAP